MTTENSALTVTAVVQDSNQSFLLNELQLKKLAKEIAKTNRQSIDALVRLLDSKDEKIVAQVAIKLLDLNIDLQKAISQDQIQRLIAEIKLNRGLKTTQLKLDNDDDDDTPIVDFTTIREV